MNKNYLMILIVCLLSATITKAQCPTTSIKLETQADIDNFSTNYPGCTVVPSGIDIEVQQSAPGTITNLNGLNQLTVVNGSLSIFLNDVLPDLYGLNNLTTVGGYLSVSSNLALSDINGLSQLTSVGGDLSVSSNSNVLNLDGLGQLTAIGGELRLWGNGSLSNVDGLAQLTTIPGDLHIYNNPALENLNGFSQVTSVGGWFNFQFNESLSNIDGLSQITSYGGNISIRFNKSLFDLDAFSNITMVNGELRIQSQDSLSHLNGLKNITTIAGGLYLQDNPRLSQCCALCPILAADANDPSVIGGGITISGNLIGCRDKAEIGSCMPCGLASTTNPIDVSSQLTVYPNPALNQLNFQYESEKYEVVSYIIENQLGQHIYNGKATSNQLEQIDVSTYPAGLYSIRVEHDDVFGVRVFQVSR